MVDYSTLIPKTEASNPATAISKEKMVKNIYHHLCPSSTLVEYSTLIPKTEASNPATAIGKEKMVKIFFTSYAPVAQWYISLLVFQRSRLQILLLTSIKTKW